MATTPRIFKRIVIVLFGTIVICILSITFIIKYHIKSVLREVIRRETNGEYQLDFSSISVSFTEGEVKIKDAGLTPADSIPHKTSYRVKMDDLYFSLRSWKQLLFHRKLFIDSVHVNHPDIIIIHQEMEENKNPASQMKEIYSSLKDISERLKVHVLEISNADIDIYKKGKDHDPFLITHIDFRIENFGQKENDKSKLRYSDNLVLRLSRQRWVFPSGQSMSFSNLSFSGNEQVFELDSILIERNSQITYPTTSLYADKLLLKAEKLSSLFEKNELNLDTVFCKSPILSFTMPGKLSQGDSTNALHQLLGNIRTQFINIENGQLQINSSDGARSYKSQKTNLKIYNLTIDHDRLQHLKADNIDLLLNEVSFSSLDSLYLLTIKEFGFNGGNLVCKNAYLQPSSKNSSYLRGINIPLFTLVDVSLQDLLEKRFKAKSILIERPQAYFTSNTKKGKGADKDISIEKVYETLNELAEMIDVHWLTVKNGKIKYYSESSNDIKLSIADINTEINLDDLLKSSSPLAIKHSIHALCIGYLKLDNDTKNIQLKNFFLNGKKETGKAKALSYDLPSGIHLNAGNIFWKKFSWDDFVKNKKISMDSMDIDKLYITVGIPYGNPKKRDVSSHIALQKLNIHRSIISINQINNQAFSAETSNVMLKRLNLLNGIWSWGDFNAKVGNILFNGGGRQITIDQMNFSAGNESNAKDITFSDLTSSVKIPTIKFQLNLSRSDLNCFDFPFLSIYKPEINIEKFQKDLSGNKKNIGTVFVPFHVQNLDIMNGHLSYKSSPNSIKISTYFNVKIASARTYDNNTGEILLDSALLNFDSIVVDTKKIPFALDKLDLQITKGSLSKAVFSAYLKSQWESLSFSKQTTKRSIEIRNLSGEVDDIALVVQSGGDNHIIENIIPKVRLSRGSIFYNDTVISASVLDVSGTGKEAHLELGKIEIVPKENQRLLFKKYPWQKDYTTFKCDKIILNRIDLQAFLEDTAVIVQNIYLQRPYVSRYRNKNLPLNHRVEKLMPTKLIAAMKIPMHFDTVHIKEASIDVHEISAITKREGLVSLRNVEGWIKNITSRPVQGDALSLGVSGRLIDFDISKLNYAESYQDSLAGFRMNYTISSMQLPALTKVTDPLSAFSVKSGYADTLFARLSGNKYAAFGEMNFYYHNLRIRFLNKEDPLKKKFSLRLKTFAANNLIIQSNNKNQSVIFFYRNKEKFIFNYWIKTLLSGLLTSTGVKSNFKYKKMYNALSQMHSMPSIHE